MVYAHLQTNNITTNALIHYRNTNSVHIKTKSSVNHCTVAHNPRPTICHCMHWHTVNHYIQTQYIVTPKTVPLKTNMICNKHLKLMRHAKHVEAKEYFESFSLLKFRLTLIVFHGFFLNYNYDFDSVLPAAGNICLFIISCIMAASLMKNASLKCRQTDVQAILSSLKNKTKLAFS